MAETAACAPAPIATAVPADTARNAWRPWAGLAVMLTGTFMAVLDVFIVNIAIPDMRDTLEASFAELQFVIAAYGLTYAVMLTTGGRLGDIFRRRRLRSEERRVGKDGVSTCSTRVSPEHYKNKKNK